MPDDRPKTHSRKNGFAQGKYETHQISPLPRTVDDRRVVYFGRERTDKRGKNDHIVHAVYAGNDIHPESVRQAQFRQQNIKRNDPSAKKHREQIELAEKRLTRKQAMTHSVRYRERKE